jgi:hypothetical protein
MTMIIVNLDVLLARRKMSVTELADKAGITIANPADLTIIPTHPWRRVPEVLTSRYPFVRGSTKPPTDARAYDPSRLRQCSGMSPEHLARVGRLCFSRFACDAGCWRSRCDG